MVAIDKAWYDQFERLEFIPLDFHTASSIGDKLKVHEILKGEKNCIDLVNKPNKYGWTPLMYASVNGHDELVSLFLKTGARIETLNPEGETALLLAAKGGNCECVTHLIEAGSDIHVTNKDGWTPLFHACSWGHHNLAVYLISKGCDANMRDKKGLTPLMIAAKEGFEVVVKKLLLHGADPAATVDSGETARDFAIEKDNTKVKDAIDAFLKESRNSSSKTTLATILGNIGLAKYVPMFEEHNIDLEGFWNLTDDDLKRIGICLYGPRTKIRTVITKYNSSQS